MHAKSLVGWCLQADRGVYGKESRNMEDDFRRREERGGMGTFVTEPQQGFHQSSTTPAPRSIS